VPRTTASQPDRPWLLSSAGMAYLVIDFTGNSVIASLPGAPSGDQSTVAAFLDRHALLISVMAWSAAASGVCLAVFGIALRRRLGASLSADVSAASALVAGCVIVTFNGLLLAASEGQEESEALLLWRLWNAGVVVTLPAAAFVLAVTVTTRAHKGPAWVRVTGPLLAALCLLPPYVGWLTLKMFPLWVAALALSLLRGRAWQPPAPVGSLLL
jgi:hypothetical protein